MIEKYITPVFMLFTDEANNNIYIKRDDMLPFSFGGNKARIARTFVDDMRAKGKDCIIGYGNARSNLSRALSNICSSEGIPCHIVSPADEDGVRRESYNSILSKKCDVRYHECLKTNVAQTVSTVIEECKAEGYDPYYVCGDIYGKGNEATPVAAYRDAYFEISAQCDGMGIRFDKIFLPVGTGMTQSGLLAGKMLKDGTESIVGISVARKAPVEKEIIKTYLEAYEKANGISPRSYDIEVDDSYLCGGYGRFDDNIRSLIDHIYSKYGLYLDGTYTGKAFYGMVEYLKKNKISDKNILFIHTGGTPLFFDYIHGNRNMDIPAPLVCTDHKKLCKFLWDIDASLPTKLSVRVDIDEFAGKVLEKGKVAAVEVGGKIIAAALFYCNDMTSKSAYVTMFGVLDEWSGKGVGKKLLDFSEKCAAGAGMNFMKLETEIRNNRAIVFYLKNGYSIEYVEKKIHMIKDLRK